MHLSLPDRKRIKVKYLSAVEGYSKQRTLQMHDVEGKPIHAGAAKKPRPRGVE